MLARFMNMGVKQLHLWGMTETSPIATALAPGPDWGNLTQDEQLDIVCKQGSIPFGVELRIVDDENIELPRDIQREIDVRPR